MRVFIRSNNDTYYTQLDIEAFGLGTYNHSVAPTKVILARPTGGLYDSPNYNSIGFNRGWIIIDYAD